jgi:histidinol dehydrogenase
MKIIQGYEESEKALSRKLAPQAFNVSPRLSASLRDLFGTEDPQAVVSIIIEKVRKSGDIALKEYSRKIDRVELENLEVSKDEIAAARAKVSSQLLVAFEKAASQIEVFHRKQFDAFMSGVNKMAPGTVARVLERVGLYVPGGTASYPSSVLMTAIPARAAGVKEIIIATPPGKDGHIPYMTLAAAAISGVSRVFALGGAQAIAAMAYGTESVPAVDKICGPGNIFVMLAKKQVYGLVDIDGLQGPSEVVVIADAYANPVWCAADILAQAEHDSMAQSIFITTSEALSLAVLKEVEASTKTLPRRIIIEESLESHGIMCIVENLEQAAALANMYAPEHLCLYVKDSEKMATRINNAGCVFVGVHPTVVMGDYVAGPSHALPTGGTARFASPLNTTDFVRLMNVVKVDAEMIAQYGPVAVAIAEAEGLTAHARAVMMAHDKEPHIR